MGTIYKYIARSVPSILILVLGTLIYSPSFDAPFHFDDKGYIVENAAVRDAGDLRAIWNAYPSPARFVGTFSFALNYRFHQLEAGGYHAVNFGIHVLNALLVWWLANLLLNNPNVISRWIKDYNKERRRRFNRRKTAVAYFAALIFFVHPVQTQAVTYLTQRYTSLAALFYLGAVCLYIKGRVGETSGRRHVAYWLLAALCAILAMLTKQTAMSLPLMIIMLELCLFRDVNASRRWAYLSAAALFVLIIPSFYGFNVPRMLSMQAPSASHDGDWLTSTTYLLTQFPVIVRYIFLFLAPVRQNVDHDIPAADGLFEPVTFLCFIALCALLTVGVRMFRRRPLVSVCVFWFFIALSVESSLIVIRHVMFEHRVYLPSVGFCILLSAAGYAGMRDFKKYAAAATIVVLTLSWLTYQRNVVWKSPETLWLDATKKSPMKSRPYNNLGYYYLQEGEYDTALVYLNKAIALNPLDPEAYNNRAVAYSQKGLHDWAIQDYDKALELKKNYFDAYYNRSLAYRKKGDALREFADYSRALSLNPQHAQRYFNRGNAFRNEGRFDLAMAEYEKAVLSDPSHVEAHLNRGGIFLMRGEYDRALNEFNMALAIAPDYAQAYNNRGTVLFRQQKYIPALNDFNLAIQSDPQYADAYFNRATILRLQENFTQALEDLNKVISLNPDLGAAYYNRALVHRSLGNDHKAFKDAQKARALGYPVGKSFLEDPRR